MIRYGSYTAVVGQMNYTYDKFLQVLTLISGETTPNLSILLTRDFIGRITSRIEPALIPAPAINYTYTYDGMDRLISGEDASNSYDELSNLVTQGVATYIYQDIDDSTSNDQMRLASFNNGRGTFNSYLYDANGNPTSISNRFTSLSYDYLNALRQIIYSQTDNYWYNDSMLRVKKTENAAGTWKTTYTMFDGDNPLMQEVYTASGRIQTTFNIIVGGRILAQFKMVYPSTASLVYFYLDNLGSRRVVISSTGAVVDRYRYSPWGIATQVVGTDDYRSFTGKDYDSTGLIYFNARYYDPIVGRFLTEDPSRKGGNWYAYCENNPINKTDPTGLDVGQNEYNKAVKENVQELTSAQDTARNDPNLQKGGSGPDKRNTDSSRTWCNQATFDVCEKTGFHTKLLTGEVGRGYTNANQASAQAYTCSHESSATLIQVTPEKAQMMANEGWTVVGTWANSNPNGSGHMATVRPTDQQFNGREGPLMSNVGDTSGIRSASAAFGSSRLSEVRYYYDAGQKF
jgi:RHS repeat-associated protein